MNTIEQTGLNAWNTGTARKRSVDIGFNLKEGGIGRAVFEFDGNLFADIEIGS